MSRLKLAVVVLVAIATGIATSSAWAQQPFEAGSLKGIQRVNIAAEVGANAAAIPGFVTPATLRTFVETGLRQAGIATNVATDPAAPTVNVYLESIPVSALVHMYSIRLEVRQEATLARDPTLTGGVVTWQEIRFGLERAQLAQQRELTIVSGLVTTELTNDWRRANPALVPVVPPAPGPPLPGPLFGLADPNAGPDGAVLAAAEATRPAVPGIANMQARWIDESCRAHIGQHGGDGEAFVRAVARDFRFTLPGTGIQGVLEELAKPASGWTARDRKAAVEAATNGELVIGGFAGIAPNPGQILIVVANPTGGVPEVARAYWEGPATSDGRAPRPVSDIFGLGGPDIYFSRKVSGD
jgi:hypothetical protein